MNVRYLSSIAGVVLCVMACSWDAAAQAPPKPTPATPATQKPKPPAKPPAKTPAKTAAKPEPAAPKEPPPPPPKPGVTMRTAYTAPDGQTSETKLITNLTRQRVELGPTVAVITQCDTKQILQVNDKHKLYVALPIDVTPASATPPAPPKKTGQVDYTTAFSSAGETKDVFGVSARRVTTVVTRTPTPTSCNKKKERIETDGWYAAIPSLTCTPPQPKPPAEATDCLDEANATSSGEPPTGSPLGYTITTFGDDGKQTGMAKMEVKELTLAPVDEAALDVPASYTKMATPAEFVAAVERAENEARWGAPKAVGVIRIGVLIPTNKTTEDVSVEAIGDELLSSLSVAPYDAVPILSKTPEDQAAEMKGKEIDYVVALDLTMLKSSAPSKVGGLMRKASGGGNPSELHEAKVDYKLFAGGGLAKPKVTKTASAKTGGFTLKRALGLAQFAARLYLGAGPGMMKMLLSQGGGGSGIGQPSQSADPSLSAFSFVFNMLGSKSGPTDETSREATVVTALRNASSDILKELGTKKDK